MAVSRKRSEMSPMCGSQAKPAGSHWRVRIHGNSTASKRIVVYSIEYLLCFYIFFFYFSNLLEACSASSKSEIGTPLQKQ